MELIVNNKMDVISRFKKYLLVIAYLTLSLGSIMTIFAGCTSITEDDITLLPFQISNPTSFADGKIVFVSDRDNGYFNLYMMNGDGRNVQRLTAHLGNDGSPIWSPDGASIAFVSDRDGVVALYLLNVITQQISLLKTKEQPAWFQSPISWSPDGQWIAYSNGKDLFLVAIDGTKEIQLTSDSTSNNPESWSPDGAQLLFRSKRDASHVAGNDYYMFNTLTNDISRLTTETMPLGNAAWSHDGKLIVFESGIRPRLSIHNIFDGQSNLLISSELYIFSELHPAEIDPYWLPDSRHIIFSWNKATKVNTDIYIMDIETQEYLQLTDDAYTDLSPRWWSP